jgi:hypothetical protein
MDQPTGPEPVGRHFERSTFVTRIRTPKNVEVSIPNAPVLSNYSINFGSQAKRKSLFSPSRHMILF